MTRVLIQNASLYVKNCENYWWLNALYVSNFNDIADIVGDFDFLEKVHKFRVFHSSQRDP